MSTTIFTDLNFDTFFKVSLVDSTTQYKGRLYIKNECGISSSLYSNDIQEYRLFDLDSDTCSNHFNTIEGEEYFCNDFGNLSYTLQGDNFSRNLNRYLIDWYLNGAKISSSLNSRTIDITNLKGGDNLLEARIDTDCKCGVYGDVGAAVTVAQKNIFLDTVCSRYNLSGKVFVVNTDSCSSPTAKTLSNAVVELNDGLFRTVTDSMGNYSFRVPEGDYKIKPAKITGVSNYCTYDSVISITSDTIRNFISEVEEVVQTFIFMGFSRPGQKKFSEIRLKNAGLSDIIGATLNITYDGPISEIITSPNWTAINNNTLTIYNINIPSQEFILIPLNAFVDSTANLGDVIQLKPSW